MKILHVSIARVKDRNDPLAWLKHLDFFTGILEEMAMQHTVESVHLINYSGTLTQRGVLYHFLKCRIFERVVPWRLNRLIRSRRPDVIVLHGLALQWQVLCLVMLNGGRSRILVQHHAEPVFQFPKSVLQRIVDRRVTGYFFSSAELAIPWVHARQIVGPLKIHEALELSSPFYSRDKETVSASPMTFLWVGRLDENKDPLLLVRAFLKFLDRCPGASLYIVFRGGYLLPEIQELLRSNALAKQIILIDTIHRSTMEEWYMKCSFIISTSRYESAGAAVCEGMSCGCIPILSNIPSFKTMTRNGEVGLLFEPGNEEGLNSCLVEALSMDVSVERKKVFEQFKSNLSFSAISNKMIKAIQLT